MIQATAAVQNLMGDPGPGAAAQQPQLRAAGHAGARRRPAPARRGGHRPDQHGQHLDRGQPPQRRQLAGGRRLATWTWAPTSRCSRRRPWSRSRSSRSSPAATPPSGRAAAAASSTWSPSRAPTSSAAAAYEFFRNDALNANSFFRKQSTRPARPRDNAGRRCATTTSATRWAGRSQKDKLFFFWSQEWRKISRAPAVDRSANVPDPAWLTDPDERRTTWRPAQRDPNAVRPARRLARRPTWAPTASSTRARTTRTRARRCCASTGRSNPSWRLMGRYTHDLSADDRAGRPLLQHRRARHRHHADRRARARCSSPSSRRRSARTC